MTDGRDRVIPNDELTVDDRAALGWAVSTDHPIGAALVERVRSGGPGVLAGALVAIHDDWERAGRPVPEHHVHRTPVALADDIEVIGVTFLAYDPTRATANRPSGSTSTSVGTRHGRMRT